MANRALESQAVPFWRDERILKVIGQIIFAVVLILFVYFFVSNMLSGLERIGLTPNLGFLNVTAGFDIGESVIEYTRASTNGQAFLVGLLNTLKVSILGIFFASILGIIVGISRLSTNWLVNKIAIVYIEILRNIPLLVLLVFWASGVFLQFPRLREDPYLLSSFLTANGDTGAWVILSNRGVAMPWGIPSSTFQTYQIILGIGLLLAIVLAVILTQQGKRTGRTPLVGLWGTLTFLAVAVIGWFVLPENPWTTDLPVITGLNTTGGTTLSPEFMALFSGLVIYTSAFIGEIVRAGIQSITRGQVEAARATGLTAFQTLRLVIFPQALRVIVPPLTSQYLNLTKNSSLALAIGYPDLLGVTSTIHNQTGRSVEVFGIMMLIYLSLSLITSFIMNIYNSRIRLVER